MELTDYLNLTWEEIFGNPKNTIWHTLRISTFRQISQKATFYTHYFEPPGEPEFDDLDG